MSMLSNLELIRRVPLFALLTCVQAESVADAIIKRRFKRGEVVVEQGHKSNTLFILLTGRARVSSPTARDNASVAIDTFSRIARGAVWWLRPKANSVIGTGSGRAKPCKIKPLLYARQQNGRRYLHHP